VTALGATASATAENWRSGRRAECRVLEELAGTSLENLTVAVLPEFDPAMRLGGRKMLKYMSEAAVLGTVAAHEAAHDAGVRRRFQPERVGLYAGTGLAAANVRDSIPMIRASMDQNGTLSYRLLGEKGLPSASPLLSFKILANMPPCIVSIIEGVKGPNLIFTPWEGQTGAALREAWLAVASGEVDCALTGGADSATHPATVVYLRKSGLLGESEYPASGAAYLVMERGETARRDGKRVYAEILDIETRPSDTLSRDPLAERIGRSFAAAPAILLALGCKICGTEVCVSGVDNQMFRARVKVAL